MPVERLAIAGVRIDLALDGPDLRVAERYGAFGGAEGPADWSIALRPGPLAVGRLTGRSVRRGGRLEVEGAEAMGSLDLASRRGEAVADRSLVAVDGLVRAALTLDVLARGGCLFHAAAVVVDGRAHLVPGRSGSGKSTFAALASAPLGDEVCAVLPDGDGLAVHGTPWWTGRPGPAPLGGVHVLAWEGQGFSPLSRRDGLRHLVANVTLFVDEPETRERAFAAAGRIAAASPFGRLAFTPRSDVDALLRGAAGATA
jgi:hypothetical protein